MDKNGKVFGKINVIDFVAIVVVVLSLIGIAIRFIPRDSAGVWVEDIREDVKLSYVLEIDGVRIFSVDALKKMGVVKDSRGFELGEIVNVEYTEKMTQTVLDDGTPVKIPIPERYIVRLTIEEDDARETDKSYIISGGTAITVGSSLTMHTRYANCSGKVVDIKKIK